MVKSHLLATSCGRQICPDCHYNKTTATSADSGKKIDFNYVVPTQTSVTQLEAEARLLVYTKEALLPAHGSTYNHDGHHPLYRVLLKHTMQ